MIKQNFKELSDILKEKFDHKNDLIQWIERNLEVKISKAHSYEKILSVLIEKGKEIKFSEKMYSCDSFLQIIEKRDIDDSLYIFSKEELKIIAKNLSQNQILWKYDSFSVDRLRKTIVKNSNLKQFQKLFPKLIQEKKILPLIQYHKSVVGPLGITRSNIDRKSMESDELVSFLSNYITQENFKQVLELTNFKKILDKYNFDEILFVFALQQCLLSYESQEGLIRIFNRLIEKEIIKILEIERFGDCIVTSCGVILEEHTDPITNLVNILLEHLSKDDLREQLDLEGIQPGPLELRLYVKCAQTKPEEIMLEEFGRTDLRSIGQQIGLVRVNKISDTHELIKYILIRLGFRLPEKIEGISKYVMILEGFKNQLKNQTESEPSTVVTKTFILNEKIIKDLIYFYSSLFWEEITNIEDRRDRVEALHEKLKSESLVEKDISILTLGQLIGLLKKMNRYFSENIELKNKLNKQLRRSILFPSEYISSISKLNDSRAKFTHDADSKTFLKTKLNPQEIIDETIRITKKLQTQKIYPICFRTLREITNEYNISYYDILDEDGNQIPVFSEELLEPGKTGFLISKTDKIAVNPIVIQKYWG